MICKAADGLSADSVLESFFLNSLCVLGASAVNPVTKAAVPLTVAVGRAFWLTLKCGSSAGLRPATGRVTWRWLLP